MYHPPSKRKQLIQRLTIYSIMSLAVLTLVSVLVFFMLGYQFNRTDGSIEQGGLVQFNTQPSGAEVVIDGKSLGTRTASRKTMTTGQHFISMQREGYKAWQKSIDVVPGSVLWLTYARLVPNELNPEHVANFKTVSSTAASSDRQSMAIKQDAATPEIHLADLSRDDVEVEKITLPANSYTPPATGGSQTFVLDTWNSSNRYLLVKHTYDKTNVEWIVVDTQDVSQTKNVTTLLGVQASQIEFSNDDARILYALVDNNVRKIDLGAVTLSGPLVSNVAEFSLYDRATIVYVTRVDEKTGTRTVGYHDEGAAKSRTIRSYGDKGQAPLHIAIGKYFSDHYVAISYDEAVEIMKGTLPRSDATDPAALKSVASMTIPGGVRHLSIVNNGRFVVAQTANAYTIHDLELHKTTTTQLKGASTTAKKLTWLDGYTVWSDRGSVLRTYEFDGANQHDIMPVSKGFSATYSPTSKYLYAIAQSEDKTYHLTRVRMILS